MPFKQSPKWELNSEEEVSSRGISLSKSERARGTKERIRRCGAFFFFSSLIFVKHLL